MSSILAIDPGLTGALVFYDTVRQIYTVLDMPVEANQIKRKGKLVNKKSIDIACLLKTIRGA